MRGKTAVAMGPGVVSRVRKSRNLVGKDPDVRRGEWWRRERRQGSRNEGQKNDGIGRGKGGRDEGCEWRGAGCGFDVGKQ